MADPHYLAPVAKLDARSLLSALNAQENLGLRFLDMAPGGEVGAAYVQWPDGRESVLTVGAKPADEVRVTAALLDTVRSQGIPAPRYEVVADVGGTVALVQERLPGALPARLTGELARQILEMLGKFEHVLAGRDDVAVPDLYLRHSGPGFSIHETLASHSARTRSVLRWVRDTGRRRHARMHGDDLVHLDLHAHNLLVDDSGTITGIVDWDGIGRGDRHFALATLRFAALGQDADADTCAWLDKVLDETLDVETLRAYWAAMSLREVDWAIRHHPERLDDVLELAESRMD